MYEDYMQNLLGYNTYDDYNGQYYYGGNRDGFYQYDCKNPYNKYNNCCNLDECYPDVYKQIYPVVKKVCVQNGNIPITKEVVENIVNEIHTHIQNNNIVELNINLENNIRNSNTTPNVRENKVEDRGINCNNCDKSGNNLLKDIIRILVIRELIGNQGTGRPPFRPPMGPQGPMGRPPFRPPFSPRYEW